MTAASTAFSVTLKGVTYVNKVLLSLRSYSHTGHDSHCLLQGLGWVWHYSI